MRVGVNAIVEGAAQSITNKHADYAAAGLAVINSQSSAEYRKYIEDYNFGINTEPGSVSSMYQAIDILYKDTDKLNNMKLKSREFAVKYMDRDITYPKLIEWIMED